jgi:hypothetical protein
MDAAWARLFPPWDASTRHPAFFTARLVKPPALLHALVPPPPPPPPPESPATAFAPLPEAPASPVTHGYVYTPALPPRPAKL